MPFLKTVWGSVAIAGVGFTIAMLIFGSVKSELAVGVVFGTPIAIFLFLENRKSNQREKVKRALQDKVAEYQSLRVSIENEESNFNNHREDVEFWEKIYEGSFISESINRNQFEYFKIDDVVYAIYPVGQFVKFEDETMYFDVPDVSDGVWLWARSKENTFEDERVPIPDKIREKVKVKMAELGAYKESVKSSITAEMRNQFRLDAEAAAGRTKSFTNTTEASSELDRKRKRCELLRKELMQKNLLIELFDEKKTS